MNTFYRTWCRLAYCSLVLGSVAHAGERPIHVFAGTGGKAPTAGLIVDSQGNLYGTTSEGGTFNVGTVYELSPTQEGGWTYKGLHIFKGGDTDGAMPAASLIFDDSGNLYGTTARGGAHDLGTVFELTPNGDGTWSESILYFFSADGGGIQPEASLVFDDLGNIYGTTFSGGSYGRGTAFELLSTTEGTWNEVDIHDFSGSDFGDGANPEGDLIFDTAGNLYGTSSAGGGAGCSQDAGCGTIFELSPSGSGWGEKLLYIFQGGNDGAVPLAGLTIDSIGNLYGTTGSGGSTKDCGTVFELSLSSDQWKETLLHRFLTKNDGKEPLSSLTFDQSGNLYGTTYGGGNYGEGTVFQLIKTSGGNWNEAHYSFGRAGDGQLPKGSVVFDSMGNLYGTTSEGGSGNGIVFEFHP